MKLGLVILAVVSLGAVCNPPPAPPPNPDASDAAPPPPPSVVDAAPAPPPPASACSNACAALAAAGCREGAAPGCAAALQNADHMRLVRTPSGAPLTCDAIAGVRTPSDARSLGIACVGAGEAPDPTPPSGSRK